jgi:hypothetical protein
MNKKITNDHKIFITTFSIPRPSKMYPHWYFGMKINHLATLNSSVEEQCQNDRLVSRLKVFIWGSRCGFAGRVIRKQIKIKKILGLLPSLARGQP